MNIISDSSISLPHKIKQRIDSLLRVEPSLARIVYKILSDGRIFIVGGYIRDIIEGKRNRDLDMVVDIPSDALYDIISEEFSNIIFNHLGGAKLSFISVDVDIWSIESNWAFRTNLVSLNENDYLQSIAKGCFYNYDSLVVCLPSYAVYTKYYKEFITKRELDILQKNPKYKNTNPTIEANILRALYIRKKYGVSYSNQLTEYIINKMLYIHDTYGNLIDRLLEVKERYRKYSLITENDIRENIRYIIRINEPTFYLKELEEL